MSNEYVEVNLNTNGNKNEMDINNNYGQNGEQVQIEASGGVHGVVEIQENNQIQPLEIVTSSKGEQKVEEEKQEEKQEDAKSVSFFKLQYTFQTCGEIASLIFATIIAMISGCSLPAFMLIFGKVINDFSMGSQTKYSPTAFIDNINLTCQYFVYIGIAIFACNALYLSIFSINGKIIARRIKFEYFKAILRQEQNWFDQFKNKFEFATKIESQIKTIESGLGVKIANLIMATCTFVGK